MKNNKNRNEKTCCQHKHYGDHKTEQISMNDNSKQPPKIDLMIYFPKRAFKMT